MFSNNKVKLEAEEITTSNNIIGKGTFIEGNIETLANIRVEGRVLGNVTTKSKLAMGEGSLIEGHILANSAEISGEIKGKIEVTDLLTLRSTAVIYGDILTSKLAVEAGAVFNGTCKMGGDVKEINLSEYVSTRAERTA
ncbi:MAG: polymer-forming cytoskeletal protein [Bacteroidota bacterium]|nr:polymer-forming cytoskeletal protein [Bacteroidota bacterium]